MTELQKRCFGWRCETAIKCIHYIVKPHPHDVLFMPSKKGHECDVFESYFEEKTDE